MAAANALSMGANALTGVGVAKDLALLGIKYYNTIEENGRHLGHYLGLCVDNRTSLDWKRTVVIDSRFLAVVKQSHRPGVELGGGVDHLDGGLSSWSQMAAKLMIHPDQMRELTKPTDDACVVDGKVAAKAKIETLALMIMHGQNVEIATFGPLSVISSSIGRLAVAPKNEAGAIAHILLEDGAAQMIGGNQVAFRELMQFTVRVHDTGTARGVPNDAAGNELLQYLGELAKYGNAVIFEDDIIYTRRLQREKALWTFVLALRQLERFLFRGNEDQNKMVVRLINLPWQTMQSPSFSDRSDFRFELLQILDELPRFFHRAPDKHKIAKDLIAVCALYGLSYSVETECQGCKFAYLA